MAARVVPVDPRDPDPEVIRQAGSTLADGGLVAFPTETVYGLGANAMKPSAVARIFEVKGRPADNPIIVHVADPAELPALVTALSPTARTFIDRFWPGPLTLVLPASEAVPEVTRGGLPTVAVRMPSHTVALALIRAAGGPVAAPSANRSGRPSPTTAEHVVADLGDTIELILDAGPTPVGVESTVVDVTGKVPVVLRPGGIPIETLATAVERVVAAADVPPGTRASGAAAELLRRSPGTRHRHYAPRARVVLVEAPPKNVGARLAASVRRLWDQGLRVGAMVTAEHARDVPAGAVVRVMGRRRNPAAIAANLFAQLRELDDAGLDAIVVEGIPERGVGRAVMDRLRRAAQPPGQDADERTPGHQPR